MDNLLPIAMKISARTIGLDLVEVRPLDGSNNPDELKKIKEEVTIKNRCGKIESLMEDKDFEEMKIEQHPDYKEGKAPSMNLFYLDMVYKSDKDK